jgi:hypothetical protein
MQCSSCRARGTVLGSESFLRQEVKNSLKKTQISSRVESRNGWDHTLSLTFGVLFLEYISWGSTLSLILSNCGNGQLIWIICTSIISSCKREG